MQTEISIADSKGYSTEANLRRALERRGLDKHPCRRIICRKPDGSWTAIFLVHEYLNKNGGYMGFAAQYGFMSI